MFGIVSARVIERKVENNVTERKYAPPPIPPYTNASTIYLNVSKNKGRAPSKYANHSQTEIKVRKTFGVRVGFVL